MSTTRTRIRKAISRQNAMRDNAIERVYVFGQGGTEAFSNAIIEALEGKWVLMPSGYIRNETGHIAVYFKGHNKIEVLYVNPTMPQKLLFDGRVHTVSDVIWVLNRVADFNGK